MGFFKINKKVARERIEKFKKGAEKVRKGMQRAEKKRRSFARKVDKFRMGVEDFASEFDVPGLDESSFEPLGAPRRKTQPKKAVHPRVVKRVEYIYEQPKKQKKKRKRQQRRNDFWGSW